MTIAAYARGMATVGFLGTGIMGVRMAARLAAAGHAVRAWNRTRAKAERLASQGVEVVATAADAAAGADVVICMLSSGPVCDEVLLGGGGGVAAVAAGPPPRVLSPNPGG